MNPFNCNRTYEARLDVRHPDSLPELESEPNGALWPLIATRRAGKTWMLRALEHRHKKRQSRYLDLRNRHDIFDAAELPSNFSKRLLLDEPGQRLRDDPQGFLKRCVKLKKAGYRLLLALTPCEWRELEEADPSGVHVNPKDLRYLLALTEAEAALLSRRSPQALSLFPRLPLQWQRNPFLLELLFQIAAGEPGRDWAISELVRKVIEESSDRRYNYLPMVFDEGLSESQREVLRQVSRGAAVAPAACELLERCGLIAASRGRFELLDPILAHHLPPPLRIHHISDIHVGPKSAERVDAKGQGPLAQAGGRGPVRQSYLDHLKALNSNGEAPHLLVISGDLAETARVEQYQEISSWLDALRACLAEHPLLTDEPRVLLVGGNHDVDWNQTLGKGRSARHQPFAAAFEGYPRPRLEVPPDERRVAAVRYEDLGIEFLLLGSAEFGGEVEEDRQRATLIDELSRLPPEAVMDSAARRRAEELAIQAAREDPGLVHHQDLLRAEQHLFNQPVRIAVLHHPVAPLPSSTEIARYAGLLNAGAVKDTLLKMGFSLVLHGHVHAGWFVCEKWPGHHQNRELRIVSAPSLGSREVQERHGFNVIEVQRDRNQDGRTTYHISVRRFGRTGLRTWKPEVEGQLGPFTIEQ